MILADKLVLLRKKSGMSQEELAEKMNVSRQAVSKWEGAQSIPDLDKILQLSELYGVTTDYLLKDEVEPEMYSGKDNDGVRKISLEEANEFIALRKSAAVKLALATFMCIVAVIPLLLLAAASEMPGSRITENMAVGIGMAVLLLIVAAAVGIFVYTGFQSSKYEFIEEEPFETEYGVSGAVKEWKKKFHSIYARLNIIGTCLCVVSPIFLFFALFNDKNDLFAVSMLALTMITAGIGVIFFVYGGVQNASMEKLLKSGEFTEENKKKAHIKSTVTVIYWLTVVAAYLLWLFLDKNSNSLSWVIFPVAGVLFPVALMITTFVSNKKKG